jgi:hypothetical protein
MQVLTCWCECHSELNTLEMIINALEIERQVIDGIYLENLALIIISDRWLANRRRYLSGRIFLGQVCSQTRRLYTIDVHLLDWIWVIISIYLAEEYMCLGKGRLCSSVEDDAEELANEESIIKCKVNRCFPSMYACLRFRTILKCKAGVVDITR